MRKLLLLLLVVTVVVTAANLRLVHVIDTQRDMYARDTVLAYEAGIKHGIEQAVDSSPDVEALTVLFARYRHADAPSYARWVVYYSAKYRVPQVILAGMVMQESSGRADARSSCGAVGLTQVRWRFWGEDLTEAGIAQQESDLYNPRIAIEACAFILRSLLDRYDGDLEKATDHYSGGARGYLDKVLRRVTG